MHLTRCQDQKNSTLEDFCGARILSDEPHSRKCGEAMLSLIERLRALPDERQVYGLTSHYHLCLLSQNTYTSPWFVKFLASGKQMYFIEYLLPEHAAPWPNAYVTGMASSEDEAVEMILKGMEKSGGWNQ